MQSTIEGGGIAAASAGGGSATRSIREPKSVGLTNIYKQLDASVV